MITTGYNQWIQISDFNEKFKIALNPPKDFLLRNFAEASSYTAKLIAAMYPNIHLCLSGGMDSEYIAKTFFLNNIQFTPVIFLCDNNIVESSYALKWCSKHAIGPVLLDYRNKNDQLSYDITRICVKHNLDSNLGAIQNLAKEKVNAPIITGFGDPMVLYNMQGTSYIELYKYDFYLRYVYGDVDPGSFFTFTPEIFFSYVNEARGTNEQETKSKLYGIPIREKIRFRPNIEKFGDIMNKLLKPIEEISYNLGTTEEVMSLLSSTISV